MEFRKRRLILAVIAFGWGGLVALGQADADTGIPCSAAVLLLKLESVTGTEKAPFEPLNRMRVDRFSGDSGVIYEHDPGNPSPYAIRVW